MMMARRGRSRAPYRGGGGGQKYRHIVTESTIYVDNKQVLCDGNLSKR